MRMFALHLLTTILSLETEICRQNA